MKDCKAIKKTQSDRKLRSNYYGLQSNLFGCNASEIRKANIDCKAIKNPLINQTAIAV
jgi:hypothetical protein